MINANLQSLCGTDNSGLHKVLEKCLMIDKAFLEQFEIQKEATKRAVDFIESKGLKDEFENQQALSKSK